jgi:hypothetical protein
MAINPQIPLMARPQIDPTPGLGQLANAIQYTQQRDAKAAEAKEVSELRDLQKQQILQKMDAAGKIQSFTDLARDSIQIKTLLSSGDVEGARSYAIDRVTRLNERRKAGENVNTIHTERFLQALEADPNQAMQMLDQEIQGLAQLGFVKTITDINGKSTDHVNAPIPMVKKDAEGNVIERQMYFPVYDKGTRTARLEPAQAAEGWELATETPEEKRHLDLMAKLEENQKILKQKQEFEPTTAADKQLAVDAVKKAEALFESVDKIGVSISNLQEAKQALLDGANTGPIISMWPSFIESSVRLENAQKRAGLDIIGATTFGALSKGEMDLSLVTALPTDLKPPELVKWIDRRIAAEQAKAEYFQRQAIFLSDRGPDGKQNTRADWEKSEKAALDAALNAFGVTDDDIKATIAGAKSRGEEMDRSQVLREIRRRYESGEGL